MAKVSDNILKRIYLLFGGFFVFAMLVVLQVLRVQLGQGERWRAEQEQELIYSKTMLADRGSILSDDGSILAITLPFYRIAMDVTVIRKSEYAAFDDSLNALCGQLAQHFGEGRYDKAYFYQKIKRAQEQQDRHIYLFPVRRTFNYQEMKRIRSFPILNRGRFRGGLIIEKINNKRFYPFGSLARITLGLMRDDTSAIKGVEYSFNNAMRGVDGKAVVQRVPGGVEIPLADFGEIEAQDGYDVRTTLNVHMQDIVYSALKRGVLQNEAKGGVAILMEVGTGHIKAIANYPEDYNYAVATQYEPGSTFKLASLIAALESGRLSVDDSVSTGNGTVQYYDRLLKDPISYGQLSLGRAFEKSSNVAISRLIYHQFKDDPRMFLDLIEQQGLLTPLGFQLKGEPDPYIIHPDNTTLWNQTTLPWLSIGYNVRLTPLQVLAYYNAIANGGRYIQPVLVHQLTHNGRVVQTFEPRVIREQVCSDQTLATVQQLLKGVVQQGTATNLRSSNYEIAGKTGTCQKLIDGEYQRMYRASFAGYFPANQPRYTLFVMVDEPTAGDFYGADVAGPIFKEIADNLYATDMEVAQPFTELADGQRGSLPEAPVVYQQDARTVFNALNISAPESPEADFVRARAGERVVRMDAISLPTDKVPNVHGMNARDAVALLENMGLKVVLRGHGRVKRQSLPAGAALKPNQTILLTLN